MYDLLIIGAGWAGFNAALQAKRLGKKACLIEKGELGGTCLNRGCIPTKVLTYCAKDTNLASFPDLSPIRKKQAEVIARLKQGMEFSLKLQKIDFIKGAAQIISPTKVLLKEEDREIEAEFILISIGSRPKGLPFLKFDHERILSSDDLLNLNSLPKSILIIGGGVIGCEFASALNKLGVGVSIAEAMERLIFMFDKDISQKLQESFKKRAITVNTSYDIKDKDLSPYEKVLLCVGRAAHLEDLVTPSLGLELDKSGFIKVDNNLRTNIKNIYAAGDCIATPQLAHVASYEGKLAVENMFGKTKEADYSCVPSSVFTEPEVAQVGLNEETAKKQSKNIKVVKKLFSSIGMAHIINETEGFLKLIIDKDSGVLLGAGIIGPQATELVNTLAIAVKYKLTTKDMSSLIFAHPSISEIFTEAIT